VRIFDFAYFLIVSRLQNLFTGRVAPTLWLGVNKSMADATY